MDDELELDLTSEEEPINRAQKRIESLTSKTKEAYKERDEAAAKAAEAEQARLAAEKRAEFLESFTGVSTKYPNATEHREAIQEKVLNNGYTVEDATVAVLAANGQFTPPVQEHLQPVTAGVSAGGSAPTTGLSGEGRPVSDMTQAERRQALIDADARGELRQILERR